MAILITGGTGKTSTRIARLLLDAKVSFVVASRRGPAAAPAGVSAVKFDWFDESTFENPFAHQFPDGQHISAVYLVAPEAGDPVAHMSHFVDVAYTKHGVRRFVMLTGTTIRKGGPKVGQVWQHAEDLGADFAVIRATWFMEQFSQQQYLPSIKNENEFSTACADGKSAFVAANDIAAIAAAMLTDPKYSKVNVTAVGRELLTHDEVAEKLTKVLGRTITHVRVTPEEKTRLSIEAGVPEPAAKFMTFLDTETANGNVASVWDEGHEHVKGMIGRPQQTFEEFAVENKAVWQQEN